MTQRKPMTAPTKSKARQDFVCGCGFRWSKLNRLLVRYLLPQNMPDYFRQATNRRHDADVAPAVEGHAAKNSLELVGPPNSHLGGLD
jgi:hypothetical protein